MVLLSEPWNPMSRGQAHRRLIRPIPQIIQTIRVNRARRQHNNLNQNHQPALMDHRENQDLVLVPNRNLFQDQAHRQVMTIIKSHRMVKLI